MNALLLEQRGSLDAFHIGRQPMPEPGRGQVRVHIKAAGLNPVDYKLALGGHPAWEYPFTLGLDGAGTVDATGPGVTDFAPGDRVVYHGNLSKPGCFAEYALADAHVLARIPDGVTFEDAAAIPCAGYTAYLALFARLKIQPGRTILIQGAAGGVGGFATQMAANHGCTVLATASEPHFDHVKDLGASTCIDYQKRDVPEAVLEYTKGAGVDYIVDPVGRETATASIRCLKFAGGIACLVRTPDTSQIPPFGVCPSIHEISLGTAYSKGTFETQSYMAFIGNAMMTMLRNGKLRAMVSEVVRLEDVPAALKRLEGRHVEGKIVLKIEF